MWRSNKREFYDYKYAILDTKHLNITAFGCWICSTEVIWRHFLLHFYYFFATVAFGM